MAAISVNTSTAKTNKAKQRFPVRRSACWPRFSGRNAMPPPPPPKPERERSGRVECIGPVWSGSGSLHRCERLSSSKQWGCGVGEGGSLSLVTLRA